MKKRKMLTIAEAIKISKELEKNSTTKNMARLAKKYDVSMTTITRILNKTGRFEKLHEVPSNDPKLMSFGQAIELAKNGAKITRRAWCNTGSWVILIKSRYCKHCSDLSPYKMNGLEHVKIGAHFDMYTKEKFMQPGWLPTASDILADDWMEAESCK